MNESFNQSMSVKKVSNKIRKVKKKYRNFCISLLILNFIAFAIQKYKEYCENEENFFLTKNIFLVLEDLGLKIVIIISLIKNQRNSIVLCSLLYFVITLIMIFYILLKLFYNQNSDNEKMEDIAIIIFIINIINIILYCIEGCLMVVCFKYMEKEKREKDKEKYGFKTGDDMLRSKNLLEENSFG